jgi:hypothetical protein
MNWQGRTETLFRMPSRSAKATEPWTAGSPRGKDEPATRRQLRAPGRRDVVRTDRENDAVEWRGLDTTRPAIGTDDPDTGDARRGQVGSGPGHDVLVEVERGHRPPSPTARASSAAL